MNNNDRVVATNIERVDPVVPMFGREVLTVFLSGVLAGALIGIGYYLLNNFVFSAVMCREGAAGSCGDAPGYAMTVSMIIGGLAGLITLAQVRVYRPLLIVLATAVSLWSFHLLIGEMVWYWGLLTLAILFGLTYTLFAWIVRLRSFVAAVVLAVLIVLLIRFVFVS